MAIALVVVEPFADYVKGDRITDVGKVSAALEHNAHQVRRILADEKQSDEKAVGPAKGNSGG